MASTDRNGDARPAPAALSAGFAGPFSADPIANGTGDTTPPTFSGCSSIDTATASSLTLHWTAGTDAVTAQANLVYDIYQAASPGAESYTAPSYSTIPGATSYVVKGLSASTAYYFVVRCRDAAGNRDTNTTEQTGTTSAAAVTQRVFVFG